MYFILHIKEVLVKICNDYASERRDNFVIEECDIQMLWMVLCHQKDP